MQKKTPKKRSVPLVTHEMKVARAERKKRVAELLLEGMITARDLRPLRLDARRRDDWAREIVTALLPRIEPTLPLFAGDDHQESGGGFDLH